jgi:hypothetical protein
MWNPFFVGQELIDVPAVSLKEVLAIPDTDCHGGQFVCIKREKETGKAHKIEQVLPKPAQDGDPRGFRSADFLNVKAPVSQEPRDT